MRNRFIPIDVTSHFPEAGKADVAIFRVTRRPNTGIFWNTSSRTPPRVVHVWPGRDMQKKRPFGCMPRKKVMLACSKIATLFTASEVFLQEATVLRAYCHKMFSCGPHRCHWVTIWLFAKFGIRTWSGVKLVRSVYWENVDKLL